MTYKLTFKEEALKEWGALDAGVREQFKKKLKERLVSPIVKSSRLRGMKNCYKIKLRSAGFRLVYQVRDRELLVSVVAVGKRERNAIYKAAVKRM
jgi:mRNA interferase RelE/StbE